ncbi:uncharacterized protein K489DRAFT_367281 [Dissoconium aciculare CBS 342.82]|uniref:Uncharacterized protein n=1 Tax=Dissoconium aciculare CBS 342.82 TaxID=1314786 RepID=A0A6J3MEH5_9PEZI|nr:uncharacterized protein K489DRAFT_367281 [Dissoconium aciculare CBS 342.82]KAF1826014.1 hypothetical protein K489DRAFT_367281 [Dissoconium aciculare CBS 342.82]
MPYRLVFVKPSSNLTNPCSQARGLQDFDQARPRRITRRWMGMARDYISKAGFLCTGRCPALYIPSTFQHVGHVQIMQGVAPWTLKHATTLGTSGFGSHTRDHYLSQPGPLGGRLPRVRHPSDKSRLVNLHIRAAIVYAFMESMLSYQCIPRLSSRDEGTAIIPSMISAAAVPVSVQVLQN